MFTFTMPSTLETRGALRSAAVEVLAWLAPATAFLSIYIGRFHGATTGVLPHLSVVLSLMAGTMIVRWALHVLVGRTLAIAFGTLLTASLVSLLVLYYVLAVVGFRSWGYLVSWGLISAYLHQAVYLGDALGPSVYGLAAVVGAGFLIVIGGFHTLFRRGDWLAATARRHSPVLVTVVGVLMLGTICLFLWRFAEFPPTERGEPLALTFNPASLERKFQSHFRPDSSRLADEEKAARAAYAKPTNAPGTNVILIVVDGLRARNMGVYGYARATTPYLSRLAEEGSLRRIARAYGICAESFCGLMGIAGSRYVHRFVDDPLTLPEVLRLHGYEIHMLLTGDHTNFYGLRKMYGQVDTYIDGSMSAGSFYINDDNAMVAALQHLRPRSTRRNYIQFHLMSNHVLAPRDPALLTFGESENYYAATGEMSLRRPTEDDKRKFVNFYDAGVAQADRTIHRLLALLREKGLMEDALVVVTADHGEFVGEHDLYGHAKGVRGEVLEVPLLWLATGKRGTLELEEDRLASQIDIAPTVLAHLGLPIPRTWLGQPLQAAVGPLQNGRAVLFQQNGEFGLVTRTAEGRIWKYWVNVESGEEQAFALDQDPSERNNQAAAIPARDRARWRSLLLPVEINVRESFSMR